MPTVIESESGQVLIPPEIQRRTGTGPGSQRSREAEGASIRVTPEPPVTPTRPEDGYGMFVCTLPGKRPLADFDVAAALFGETLADEARL